MSETPESLRSVLMDAETEHYRSQIRPVELGEVWAVANGLAHVLQLWIDYEALDAGRFEEKYGLGEDFGIRDLAQRAGAAIELATRVLPASSGGSVTERHDAALQHQQWNKALIAAFEQKQEKKKSP